MVLEKVKLTMQYIIHNYPNFIKKDKKIHWKKQNKKRLNEYILLYIFAIVSFSCEILGMGGMSC